MPELKIEELRHSQELGTYHSPTVPGLRTSDLKGHFSEFGSLSSADQDIVLEVSQGRARKEAIILSNDVIYQFEHNEGGGYTVRRRFVALAKAGGAHSSSSTTGVNISEWTLTAATRTLLVSAVFILALVSGTFYQVYILKGEVSHNRVALSSDINAIPEKTFNYLDTKDERLARSSDVSVARNQSTAKAIYMLFKSDKNLLNKGEAQVEKSVLEILDVSPDGNRH
jgi:hypothetical protein